MFRSSDLVSREKIPIRGWCGTKLSKAVPLSLPDSFSLQLAFWFQCRGTLVSAGTFHSSDLVSRVKIPNRGWFLPGAYFIFLPVHVLSSLVICSMWCFLVVLMVCVQWKMDLVALMSSVAESCIF
jgi:hypothetical protein